MMNLKKRLTALFSASGNKPAPTPEPVVQEIDPQTVLFSMPTIAGDEIEFDVPSPEMAEHAPSFHEDDWCQIEYLPHASLATIQALLSEYKDFEHAHRTEYGWTDIYARHLERGVLVEGQDAVNILAQSLQATLLPAPLLTTASTLLGQVKDGFTLALPDSVYLYGTVAPDGILSLGAIVGQEGNHTQLVNAFVTLHRMHQLVLVDWSSQQVLVAVDESGRIELWRP